MPNMSISSYSHFRNCPRLYYWQSLLYFRRVEKENDSRGFGTLFHAGLEVWWSVAGEGDVPWADEWLDKALKAIDYECVPYESECEECKADDGEPCTQDGKVLINQRICPGNANRKMVLPVIDKWELAEAKVMMTGYHHWWKELEFTLLPSGGIEEFFNVPLMTPRGELIPKWRLVGKKDARVQVKDEIKPFVVEHKTTTSDIEPGSPYWEVKSLDMQISAYLDSEQIQGMDIDEVLFDVAKRPKAEPRLATPPEKQTLTQGKGCKECGGSAKAGAVAQGKGHTEVLMPGKKKPIKADCAWCNGTGWKKDEEGVPQAPRLHANQRYEDEPVEDYASRMTEQLAENPGLYFQQAKVKRTKGQISEARMNLVGTALEIDFLKERALKLGDGDIGSPWARYAFPQNDKVCRAMWGRDCDFFEVCSHQIEHPSESPLYQITRKTKANTKKPGEKPDVQIGMDLGETTP